jgi:hypothetical protein
MLGYLARFCVQCLFEFVCIMTWPLFSAVYTLSAFAEDNAKFWLCFIWVFDLACTRETVKRTAPLHGQGTIRALCFFRYVERVLSIFKLHVWLFQILESPNKSFL